MKMTKEELFKKVTAGKLCSDEKDYIPKKVVHIEIDTKKKGNTNEQRS